MKDIDTTEIMLYQIRTLLSRRPDWHLCDLIKRAADAGRSCEGANEDCEIDTVEDETLCVGLGYLMVTTKSLRKRSKRKLDFERVQEQLDRL
jgi:hypothetical protein